MGVGREHMNAPINGRKNPSPKLAARLEEVTGVNKTIWVFGMPEERRAAWNKVKFKESRP